MESSIKNVTLAFCCQEDWHSFSTIDDRTRFCGSCQHAVMDFTTANQFQFEQAMQNGQPVCGRFKSSQLSETFLKLAAASLIATSSISTTSCIDDNASSSFQNPLSEVQIQEHIMMGIPMPPDSLHIVPRIIPDATEVNSKKAPDNSHR